MKKIVLIVSLLVGILLGAIICYICIPKEVTKLRVAVENAYKYLADSYNSTLGLCYEYPGNNTYWVTHDNVLAGYVLQQWNKTIADNITNTVKRIAREYNLTINTADREHDEVHAANRI